MFCTSRWLRMSNWYIRKFSLLTVGLLSLGACSHGIQIAEHADDYNVSVETAENRMFLRNIIRGAMGYPMYFTRITSLSSNLSSSFDLTPDFRIGADGATEDPLSGLKLSTSSKPTVQHSVLQSKEFFQGIYSPVDPDTLNLFLHHGWPEDLVLAVFIEGVEVHEVDPASGDGFLCRIDNDPTDAEDILAFEEFLNIVRGRLEPTPKKSFRAFGPKMKSSDIENAEALKQLKETDLALLPVESSGARFEDPPDNPSHFRLFSVSSTDQYKIDVENVISSAVFAQLTGYQSGAKKPLNCLKKTVEMYRAAKKPLSSFKVGDRKLAVDIRLRSPQGMIYYLGQLARVDMGLADQQPIEGGETVESADVNQRFTLSSVLEGPTAVSVLFGPTLYSVAEADYQTMQMITLARQVFTLKSSSDKPPSSPSTVRLFTD